MSGTDIAQQIANAYREVAREVGKGAFDITLLQQASSPLNPWDVSSSPYSSIDLPGTISAYALSQIDGTLIQAGDKRVQIAATGPEPRVGDNLIIKEQKHRIVSVRLLSPSGVAIKYECQARI